MTTTDLIPVTGVWGVPLSAGDPLRLGPYRLSRRLGTGGMATVYLGHDGAGREAAVKVVRTDATADAGFAARLVREVRVLSKVTSPAVASLLDADVLGDPAWLAIEFVPGESLASRVADSGPLPVADWSVLAVQLLEAVAALHGAGVVHRDLTPGNVVLGAGGPKIIDFGTALSSLSTRVTGTGLAVGTPGWMAPEQLDGRRVTVAADIYSAGCLLAYAATGRPPHGTGSRQEVSHRVLESPVDVDDLPVLLQRFIAELTRKDPSQRPAAAAAAQRWAEVSEVVQATAVGPALLQLAVAPTEITKPVRSGRRRVSAAGLTAAVAALVVGLGVGALLAQGSSISSEAADPRSTAGPPPATVVAPLQAPSGDPTSPEELTALQQAAFSNAHPIPGGSVQVLEVGSGNGAAPSVLIATVTADFDHTLDGDHELSVTASGMEDTSAHYSTCLDVPAGATERVEMHSVDDTARERWTSLHVELLKSAGCSASSGGGWSSGQ